MCARIDSHQPSEIATKEEPLRTFYLLLTLLTACGQLDADDDLYSTDQGDCDDDDPSVHPDATELCDQIDNNCDGVVDENTASDSLTLYVDADEDGYGDPNRMAKSCQEIIGWTSNNADCDDDEPTVSPDQVEQPGNQIDEDCDPQPGD